MYRKNNTLVYLILFLLVVGLFSFVAGQKNGGLQIQGPTLIPTHILTRQVKAAEISPTRIAVSQTISSEAAVVKRVIDGDTFVLTDGRVVRYIGIDAPETVDPQKPVQCFGKESSDFDKSLLTGKTISMTKDISNTDKYGRLLRYVYIGSFASNSSDIDLAPQASHSHPSPLSQREGNNGMFVNQYLVEEGYAYATAYPPDTKFQSLFSSAEKEAKENGRGLWKVCGERRQ